MKRILVAAVCTLTVLMSGSTVLPALAQTAPSKLISLFQSKSYVAANTREQHFEDSLTLAPGQELLPMTLVVRNGADGKVPFNWFRINIAGYLMASEQDLKGGKRQAAIDVTGRIQGGMSQIIIDAAGEPGATLSFSLVTTPVSLESVEPSIVMQGQTIHLTGRNFAPSEDQNTVLINGKPVPVLASSATAITARVPADAKAGTNTLQVSVNGVPTKSLAITVGARAVPVLHSTNYWMAPPGAILTISGANFAPNPGDNKVIFQNVPGQVVAATPTRLRVVIPNWAYGPQQMNIPLYVVSLGVRSGNYLPFDIGPKYLGATPPMPGDSISEAGWPLDAGSEASSQAGSEASFEASSQAGSERGSEASFQAGSEAGSEAPGPMIYP